MSSSHSSSATNRTALPKEGPFCHCRRRTSLTKAWTDDNPGRYFYRCKAHGFLVWADIDDPYGWQHRSLLEARDEIRLLRSEISRLQTTITNHTNHPQHTDVEIVSNTLHPEVVKPHIHCDHGDSLLRYFIFIFMTCFFVLVIAVIVTSLKH